MGNYISKYSGAQIDLSVASGSTTTGIISGSTISGSKLHVVGDAFIGGDLTLGDADTDSISIGADLTSNLIPNADGTYNLGSATKRWAQLHTDDIKVEGNISASGFIYTDTYISASGNISASGEIASKGGKITVTGTNPYFIARESSGEFLKMGVDVDNNVTFIGWDNSDDLELGLLSNDSDTTVDPKIIIKSDGKVGIGTTTPGATLGVSGNISASGNITTTGTGSFGRLETTIVSSSIIYSSGSNIFGDEASDTHTFNGHITASGNISSSGTITGNSLVGTLATAAQTNITSVGTIGTGVWQGTKVANAYLDDDTAHLTTDQTFTGNKIFSTGISGSGGIFLNETGSNFQLGVRPNNGVLFASSSGKLFYQSGSTLASVVDLTSAGGGGTGTITALNNQAESRLVTIGSTTTELDGEANLTFDGSTLTSTGNISASNSLVAGTLNPTFNAVSMSNGNISMSGDLYAGGNITASHLAASEGIYIPENEKIIFDTSDTSIYADGNGTENLVLEADGRIYLSPDSDVWVREGSSSWAKFMGSGRYLNIDGKLNVGALIEPEDGIAIQALGSISSSGDLYLQGSSSIGWSTPQLSIPEGGLKISGSISCSSDIRLDGKNRITFGSNSEPGDSYIHGDGNNLSIYADQRIYLKPDSDIWIYPGPWIKMFGATKYMNVDGKFSCGDDTNLTTEPAAGIGLQVLGSISASGNFYNNVSTTKPVISSSGEVNIETNVATASFTVSGSYSKVFMYNLPSSDPGVAGQLWDSSGDLKISQG